MEKKKSKQLRTYFKLSIIALAFGIFSVVRIFHDGLGVLGLNQNIFWGILITNFVFWIGIGHAGTFISAILLLLRQNWRNSINRSAELMTLISIFIASLLPIIHLGKAQWFYYLLPVSNKTQYFLLNFSSPLSWDFYAISSYFLISAIFFYIGLLPDFALLRDRYSNLKKKVFFNFLAFGWTGNYQNWKDHRKIMFILAAIITPLVISVHSIVSLDFAVTLKVGWHSVLFPVYFVAGAIHSGFAMLIILLLMIRKSFNFNEFIQKTHFVNIHKLILLSSIILLIKR